MKSIIDSLLLLLTKLRCHFSPVPLFCTGYMFHNNLENATSSLWELWNGPTEGPGMNSRNHHMFSSISAWFVQHVSGLQNINCASRTAQIRLGAVPLRSTHLKRELPCGEVSVDFERHGGSQCLVVPEGAESILSCGQNGEVVFSQRSHSTLADADVLSSRLTPIQRP